MLETKRKKNESENGEHNQILKNVEISTNGGFERERKDSDKTNSRRA